MEVFEYNGEGNFGELALLYNQPRAATIQVLIMFYMTYTNNFTFSQLRRGKYRNEVKEQNTQAMSEGTLWKMDRQTFRKIVLKSAFQVMTINT